MNKRTLAVVPVAAALAVLLPGTAAQAGDLSEFDFGPPQADVLSVDGPVQFKKGHAKISFTYTCDGPDDAALWLSVKQLPDASAQDASWLDPSVEGTSEASAAWYDVHTTIPCKGDRPVSRTINVAMHPTTFSGRPLERLEDGVGFVQICISGVDDSFLHGSYSWEPVAAR